MLAVVVGSCILACLYDVEFNPVSKKVYPERRKRYQRLSKWLPLGLVYALFYTSRYNIIAGNVPEVRDKLGFSASEFGLVISGGFWMYAVSAPFTGYLSDHVGARFSLIVAVLGCAISNLALGVYFSISNKASSLLLFITLYSINIFFQGFGTAAIIKVNGLLYAPEERGVFAGLFNILITSGYYLALAVCPQLVTSCGWPSVFIAPGTGLMFCLFLIICLVPRDQLLREAEFQCCKDIESDGSSKLLQNEALSEDENVATSVDAASSKQSPLIILLHSPTFPLYLIAIMCTSWTRDSLLTWMYSFFASENDGNSLEGDDISLLAGAVTFGGFVGGLACGKISDLCFAGKRVQPMLFFNACQFFAIVALYLMRFSNPIVLAICVFFICVFLLGNYTLLSYTIPTDLESSLMGTAAGIMTAVGYIASGTSGLVLGKTITLFGYLEGWLVPMLAATALCSAVVLAAYFRQGRDSNPSVPSPYDGLSIPSEGVLRSGSVDCSSTGDDFVAVLGSDLCKWSLVPARVRNAGIADERLRSRYGTMCFYQFASSDPTSIADRLAWRLGFHDTNDIDPVKPCEKKSTAASLFLKARREDPTSYFGKSDSRRWVMPW
eukprot:CAMPEP_0204846250 /NCGR_PEP_ID=MMETSP1347-20130617/1840_1 /ASSEMBLY_ACC=CAM_ASM_000690 /TAXON_ID=215587 /ORGANISM="Aplanochytrium stocchinoi, Strain GSBS06" /LENGTH=608 /DNA_ID=CAMNT_0051986727 /DNA_START=217 /DNA_END=2043 /DNA_ORIENTATION=+